MFFTKVDNFFNWLFKDLNGKFEVRTLVTLLLGIVIGIIISASLYGILLLISLKISSEILDNFTSVYRVFKYGFFTGFHFRFPPQN